MVASFVFLMGATRCEIFILMFFAGNSPAQKKKKKKPALSREGYSCPL